jgi:hypothetical protein
VTTPTTPAALAAEHRRLDDLFGAFLGACAGGNAEAARDAMRAFDDALGRHTAFEEDSLIGEATGHRLVPGAEESVNERLFRELRLEHVQVRELSAMIRRLLEEKSDLEGARRLAPNLARRWDAHTTREEAELFPSPRK